MEEEGALTGVRRQGCSLVQPCIQGYWQASSVVDSLNFLTRASVMGHLHCQPGWIENHYGNTSGCVWEGPVRKV